MNILDLHYPLTFFFSLHNKSIGYVISSPTTGSDGGEVGCEVSHQDESMKCSFSQIILEAGGMGSYRLRRKERKAGGKWWLYSTWYRKRKMLSNCRNLTQLAISLNVWYFRRVCV